MEKKLIREGLFDFVYGVLDHIDNVLESGKQEYIKRELNRIEKKYGSDGLASDLNKYVDAKTNAVKTIAKKKEPRPGDKEYEEVLRAMGVSELKIKQLMNS